MEVVAYRLRFFPLRSPFYCRGCTRTLAEEKGWFLKKDISRIAAIPIVRDRYGRVRHVGVRRRITKAQGYIRDDEVERDPQLVQAIIQDIAYLGLRLAPSLTAPVAEHIRCKRCGELLEECPSSP